MRNEIPAYQDPEANKYVKKFNNNRIKTSLAVIGGMITGIDEADFTPIRDLQYFGNQHFQHFFGPHHFTGNIVGLGFSAIAVLPYIAKALHKNEKNKLEDLLKNLENEIHDVTLVKYESHRKKLEESFNRILRKKQVSHYIEARIVEKNGKYDLKFYYKPASVIKNIFIDEWEQHKNKNFFQLSQELFPEIFNEPLPDNSFNIDKIANAFLKKLAPETCPPEILNRYEKFAWAINKLVQKTYNDVAFYEKNKDFCENLLAYARIYPAFYDKNKGDFVEDTFEQCRLKVLERLNKYNVLTNTVATANDFSMAFWISMDPANTVLNNPDTTSWNPKLQLIIIGVTISITLLQGALKLANYLKNKFKKSDIQKGEAGGAKEPVKAGLNNYEAAGVATATPKPDKKIIDQSLKHQVLETYFIEQVNEYYLRKARQKSNHKPLSLLIEKPFYQEKIQELLSKTDPESARDVGIITEEEWNKLGKTIQKRIHKKNTVYKTAQQFALLAHEAKTEFRKQNSFKRLFNIADIVMGRGIQVSFLGWALGATLFAVGATVAGAFLLSNPIGLACFGIGMLAGVYYSYKTIKKNQAEEKQLEENLTNNEAKISKLKTLEVQNRKLESLLIANGQEPLTIVKSHHDRAARQLTTKKDKKYTKTKKTLTRSATGIGRAGTAILIVRLTVIPAITIATSAAIAGPIGLGIALAFSVIWAALHIYRYHRESKLEAAKRTLADIDNRIYEEEKNQEILLCQLNYEKKIEEKKADQQKQNEAIQPQEKTKDEVATKPVTIKNSSVVFFKKEDIIINRIKNLALKLENSHKEDNIINRIKNSLSKSESNTDNTEAALVEKNLIFEIFELKELLKSHGRTIESFKNISSANLYNAVKMLEAMDNPSSDSMPAIRRVN